jgi:2,4-dienoyl-CoA reductase-like NADH-dependent reductase (Old Yellow Enzyme family)
MDLQISKPLTLPCGLKLPNRLVKAAMAEQMADGRHLPGEIFRASYGEWADGGWGLLLTGKPSQHLPSATVLIPQATSKSTQIISADQKTQQSMQPKNHMSSTPGRNGHQPVLETAHQQSCKSTTQDDSLLSGPASAVCFRRPSRPALCHSIWAMGSCRDCSDPSSSARRRR